MSKMKNNLIGFGLVIMAILTLSGISPKTADAYMTYGQYIIPPDAPLPERNPIPIIVYLTPKKIDAGQGSQVIRVSGSGFVSQSVVYFDGKPRPTAYESSSRLLVRLSQSDVNKLGDHLITVVSPGPGGGSSHPKIFEVENPGNDYSNIQYQGGSDSDYFFNDSNSFNDNENYGRNLSGSAVNSGFLPSTFMQWLALAILILLIVIIWRRLYKKKHEEGPLKHA